jgi:hypothetical protein
MAASQTVAPCLVSMRNRVGRSEPEGEKKKRRSRLAGLFPEPGLDMEMRTRGGSWTSLWRSTPRHAQRKLTAANVQSPESEKVPSELAD